MSMVDNYDLFEAHEAEQERWLDKLPRCSECGEAIQDEYLYEINGELVCPDCMEENHRKWVDDYIE